MRISYKGFLRERVQRKVITIRPEASFYEANTLIGEKGIRHLPVVDADHKLVGLLTDRDLIITEERRVLRQERIAAEASY